MSEVKFQPPSYLSVTGNKSITFKQVMTVVTVAILIGVIVYIIIKSARRNNVKENCLDNFNARICSRALLATGSETASKVIPLATACQVPYSPVCYGAMATAVFSELEKGQ